jgi:hypothetical protein
MFISIICKCIGTLLGKKVKNLFLDKYILNKNLILNNFLELSLIIIFNTIFLFILNNELVLNNTYLLKITLYLLLIILFDSFITNVYDEDMLKKNKKKKNLLSNINLMFYEKYLYDSRIAIRPCIY